MRLRRRAWVAIAGLLGLIAITVFAPTWVVVAAWVIAALLLAGAGLGASPAIQLRGRVNRIDSGAGRRVRAAASSS
jgi:hypothetical protein